MGEVMNAPAPWNVKGRAYWIVYRFPETFMREAFGPNATPAGGIGFVGLVDYSSTNVGVYQELMLIPGRARYPGATGYSVSHIVVDSEASMVNGRANWGIPKGMATFDWRQDDDAAEHIVAQQEGETMLDIRLRPRGPAMPFHSGLVPGGLSIVQRPENKTLKTRFMTRCRMRWARVEACRSPGTRFPDVSPFKPLGVIYMPSFDIDMQPATVCGQQQGQVA